MKRIYYLAIAAVLTAIVIFSMLNYTTLLVLYTKYIDPHHINVFFITRHGKLIQNVSVSLFAFYPTSNGTVIKQIYQGFNLTYLSIPVSNLTWHAKQWLGTYNYTILIPNGTSIIKKHILYNASLIIPSLIGFVSYYVVNQTNGTIIIYSQPFSVRVSPYNITHGIGKTVFKVFLNPIVKRIKINESSSSASSNVVNPQQTTTTVTTTVPNEIGGGAGILYVLHNYWVYPDNSSYLGPIPLAMVYVTDYNKFDYKGTLGMYVQAASSSGLSISFGISVAYGALNFKIAGTSITLSSGSYSTTQIAYFGNVTSYYPPWSYPYFAEIYTEGQIAIANYTEYAMELKPPFYRTYELVPIGYVFMFFATALEVVGENGAYAPVLYATSELPSNVQPFFNNTLGFATDVLPYGINTWMSGDLQVSTSQGDLGGAIPIKALLQFAFDIPDWVFDVVSPYVAITLFTEGASSNYVEITISSQSSNTYYIYYENTTALYNIGGNNYNLLMYYFYVNYTN